MQMHTDIADKQILRNLLCSRHIPGLQILQILHVDIHFVGLIILSLLYNSYIHLSTRYSSSCTVATINL